MMDNDGKSVQDEAQSMSKGQQSVLDFNDRQSQENTQEAYFNRGISGSNFIMTDLEINRLAAIR